MVVSKSSEYVKDNVEKMEEHFSLIKTHHCQPPQNNTPIYMVVEDQLNNSMPSHMIDESDGFNTAETSIDESDGDCEDKELHEFLVAEMLIEKLKHHEEEKNETALPANTSDEIIFCDEKGALHKLCSELSWNDTDAVNKMECGLQINASEVMDNDSSGMFCSNPSHSPHSFFCSEMSSNTSALEDMNTTWFSNSKKDSLTRCSISNQHIPTTRNAGDGFDISPNACCNVRRSRSDNILQKEHSTHSVTELKTVDSLIEHIEGLLKNDSERDQTDLKDTSLNLPVQQLSPATKQEVHSFLREAAESFDLTDLSMDESRSSLSLLRSIISEAGKKYGFLDDDWPMHLIKEQNNHEKKNHSLPVDHTDHVISNNTKKVTKKKGLSQSQIPRLVRASESSTNDSCVSSPLLHTTTNAKSASPVKPRNFGLTRLAPSAPTIKQKASDSEGSLMLPPSEPALTNHGGNIVQKMECRPKKSEDRLNTEFYSCKQYHCATRGVKPAKKFKTCHCMKKVHSGKKNPEKVRFPSIEQFTTSTKTGSTCFFEILKTKIAVPLNNAKKSFVGATIPIPLRSEALWTNGELSVQVKEIDKEAAHIPFGKKKGFTKMPHTITIDYVREHKERSVTSASKSPSVLKRSSQREPTAAQSKEHQSKEHYPSNRLRPFNTKVDFIFKKDPLVLGTLDRQRLATKKLIGQNKHRKSAIPMYCIV